MDWFFYPCQSLVTCFRQVTRSTYNIPWYLVLYCMQTLPPSTANIDSRPRASIRCLISGDPVSMNSKYTSALQNHDFEKVNHSLCNMTINPITPNKTVFNHGCSLNMIVTYPTPGIYPRTLPTISSLRSRKSCPRAYSSVSSARLLSPFVSNFWGAMVGSLSLGLD
jgi:hypothetical protein